VAQFTKLGELLADGRILRMKTLAGEGITASTVQRAVAAGMVEQISRGVYRRAGAPHVAGIHLAEALARIPNGVVCLLSAAEAHGFGDRASPRIWVALPNKSHPPHIDWPPVRSVLWRGEAPFRVGVSERIICGVRVRMTGRARTVVDMLKMKATVGEEYALECLRDFVTSGGALGDLLQTADALGVAGRLSSLIRSAYIRAGVP
jgi:predicted transcriptional regulator of viral defense system